MFHKSTPFLFILALLATPTIIECSTTIPSPNEMPDQIAKDKTGATLYNIAGVVYSQSADNSLNQVSLEFICQALYGNSNQDTYCYGGSPNFYLLDIANNSLGKNFTCQDIKNCPQMREVQQNDIVGRFCFARDLDGDHQITLFDTANQRCLDGFPAQQGEYFDIAPTKDKIYIMMDLGDTGDIIIGGFDPNTYAFEKVADLPQVEAPYSLRTANNSQYLVALGYFSFSVYSIAKGEVTDHISFKNEVYGNVAYDAILVMEGDGSKATQFYIDSDGKIQQLREILASDLGFGDIQLFYPSYEFDSTFVFAVLENPMGLPDQIRIEKNSEPFYEQGIKSIQTLSFTLSNQTNVLLTPVGYYLTNPENQDQKIFVPSPFDVFYSSQYNSNQKFTIFQQGGSCILTYFDVSNSQISASTIQDCTEDIPRAIVSAQITQDNKIDLIALLGSKLHRFIDGHQVCIFDGDFTADSEGVVGANNGTATIYTYNTGNPFGYSQANIFNLTDGSSILKFQVPSTKFYKLNETLVISLLDEKIGAQISILDIVNNKIVKSVHVSLTNVISVVAFGDGFVVQVDDDKHSVYQIAGDGTTQKLEYNVYYLENSLHGVDENLVYIRGVSDPVGLLTVFKYDDEEEIAIKL